MAGEQEALGVVIGEGAVAGEGGVVSFLEEEVFVGRDQLEVQADV